MVHIWMVRILHFQALPVTAELHTLAHESSVICFSWPFRQAAIRSGLSHCTAVLEWDSC